VAKSKSSSDGDCGISKLISFSHVVSKRTYNFSGHVYNLQTKSNWYHANGVVVHNCQWSTLVKSFYDEDLATKSLTAGYSAAGGPGVQSGGGALSPESLEKDEEAKRNKKKDAALKDVMRSFGYDLNAISKAFDYLYDLRPDFSDEAAILFIQHLISKGDRND
jgi:hypothetical protein